MPLTGVIQVLGHSPQLGEAEEVAPTVAQAEPETGETAGLAVAHIPFWGHSPAAAHRVRAMTVVLVQQMTQPLKCMSVAAEVAQEERGLLEAWPF